MPGAVRAFSVLAMKAIVGVCAVVGAAAAGLTVVAGYLLDSAGSPAVGGTLTIYSVSDGAHGTSVSTPVATSTTAAGGSFSVVLAPGSLPRDSTGSIPLQLGYTSATGPDLLYDVRLTRGRGSAPGWSLELPATTVEMAPTYAALPRPVFQVGKGAVEADDITPGVARTLQGAVLATADGSVVTTSLPRLQASRDPSVMETPRSAPRKGFDAAEQAARAPDAGVAAPGRGIDTEMTTASSTAVTSCANAMPVKSIPTRMIWMDTGAAAYRYIPTKLVLTRNKARQSWEFTRTNETTLSVMDNVGGNSYAGGFSGSRYQVTNLAWDVVVPPNRRKLFKVEWEYVQQRAHCDYVAISNPPQNEPAIDVWRWVPYKALSGNQLVNTTRPIRCGGPGHRYNSWYAVKTTIATESDVTYVDSFSIAGVGLSSEQRDGAGEKLAVEPLRGKSAKLCGNDGRPDVADQVREVRTR